VTRIKTRQNEDLALDLQCVARYYFNKAEILNFITWCLCILSFLSALIPETAPELVCVGVPFAFDVSAFILICCFNKSVSLGSEYRAIFDDYVFGFNDSVSLSQALKERIVKIKEKRAKWINIQKRNTGRDNPPGVRDWYDVDEREAEEDSILKCQTENGWWDRKLTPWRIGCEILIAAVYIVIFCLIIRAGYLTLLQVILSSALFLRICERIYENLKYMRIGIKIDGKIEILEVSRTRQQLQNLQATINKKRRVKIVGINFIHIKFACKLSNLYNKINDRED